MRVQLVETHISYLFLTGRHVYKVKKPVDFGFLDFTTLEKRRHFCQQEVALNRRLSPDVYLGVVEVREQDGSYSFGGPGRTVEYAVRMRQLPRDRAMVELLRRGELRPEDIRRVAQRLWAFHRDAKTGEEIARLGGLEAVRQNTQENFTQTTAYVGRTLSRQAYDLLRAYTEAFLEVRRDLFLQRAAQGRVRDGHGDLHTAQIFLEDGIQFIDCIEFNERFRYGDVASDLAFLAMDLDFHGRPDPSRTLVDAYVEQSGDRGLLELLDFFKCYRAYVRGKVTGFRLDEPALAPEAREAIAQEARRYFSLAASYAAPKTPFMLVLAGLMGTGKSTVAADLAESLGAVRPVPVVSSDVVRKERAGVAPGQHRYEPWGKGIYSKKASDETYEALLKRAREHLAQGEGVILDASFRNTSWRLAARSLAGEMATPFLLMECVCPVETVRQRLDLRQEGGESVSDGRWEIYAQQEASFEPIVELSPGEHMTLDTSGPREGVAYQALLSLYKTLLRAQDKG